MKIFDNAERNENMGAWVLISVISLFPWSLVMEYHSAIPKIMAAQAMSILFYGVWKEYFRS